MLGMSRRPAKIDHMNVHESVHPPRNTARVFNSPAELSTISGRPTSLLGLAAYPQQDPRCVRRAFESGINFFFFYGPGQKDFVDGLAGLVQQQRDELIIASGSGARTSSGLRAARRNILAAVGADTIDIFFAEYIHPGDSEAAVFGAGGVFDELQQWKREGRIRYVGASAHDRQLAKKLASDVRVDVLMHRFNMAHRKAEAEVFPAALATHTPVIAFTATRWGTLLEAHPKWDRHAPTAADCYRFCLAQLAVNVVLMAPKSIAELEENLHVLKSPPMNDSDQTHWKRFGDLVYRECGAQDHDFESQWP
jgi:aryl-alcohol dehydrogenase-like predicted oxidoreductase